MFVNLEKYTTRAGELAQQLRAPFKGLNSIPNTHVRSLMTVCASCSWESYTHFRPLPGPAWTSVSTYRHTYFIFILRRDLMMQSWLARNFTIAYPQRSVCFSLLCSGIKGMCHHAKAIMFSSLKHSVQKRDQDLVRGGRTH